MPVEGALGWMTAQLLMSLIGQHRLAFELMALKIWTEKTWGLEQQCGGIIRRVLTAKRVLWMT